MSPSSSDERRSCGRRGDRRSAAASGQGRRRPRAFRKRGRSGVRHHHDRRRHAVADGRASDGAAGARRDRRRDHRRGADHARQGAARSRRRPARSTPAAPAATAPARFNISTASALVAAGCGVPVAKHGNRALSSQSGSADVLTALGVNIDADIGGRAALPVGSRHRLLMAPRHHSAMKHVAPTRVELGTRTIFNLLGPMSNPAGARRQLVGVFAPEWVGRWPKCWAGSAPSAPGWCTAPASTN